MDPSHTTLSPAIENMEVDELPKRKKRVMSKSSKSSKKMRLTSLSIRLTSSYLTQTTHRARLTFQDSSLAASYSYFFHPLFSLFVIKNTRACKIQKHKPTKTSSKKSRTRHERTPQAILRTRKEPWMSSPFKLALLTRIFRLSKVMDRMKKRRQRRNRLKVCETKLCANFSDSHTNTRIVLIVELKAWSQSAHVHQTSTHLIKYLDLALSENALKKLKAIDFEAMKSLLDRPDSPPWISADGGSRVIVALTLEREPQDLMQVRDETTLAIPSTGNWNQFMLDMCRLLAITDFANVIMVIVGSGGLTLSRFVANSHNQCRGLSFHLWGKCCRQHNTHSQVRQGSRSTRLRDTGSTRTNRVRLPILTRTKPRFYRWVRQETNREDCRCNFRREAWSDSEDSRLLTSWRQYAGNLTIQDTRRRLFGYSRRDELHR